MTTKADIWGLGMILYQWAYDEKHPYETLPGGEIAQIKALKNLDVPISLKPLQDPLLEDTIRLCLEKRIENRPTARNLLSHPFLNPLSL